MMTEKKLTLDDIARQAGVSRATASRAINNRPDVSQNAKDRVLEVVAQTGYKPNAAARSLASQRTSTIGLVITRAVRGIFSDTYYAHLLEGIIQACNQLGYTLSLFVEYDLESLFGRISQQGLVDGIVVDAEQKDYPVIQRLERDRIPMVLLGHPPKGINVSYIGFDNQQGAYQAVAFLMQVGFQRIGMISGPSESIPGNDRLAGYQQAFQERNCPLENNLIVESDFTELGGYRAAKRLLGEKPDAIFAASDLMALGALRAIHEVGLAVPENIALIGFGDSPGASLTRPRLTTIRQPVKQIGLKAVETLVDILEYGIEPTRRIIFDPELIIRDTCGSIHKRT